MRLSPKSLLAGDAEVPKLPKATCLVEVLKECKRAVAGEEIYQVAGDGGHSIKNATTVLCARAPLDVGGGMEMEGL